MQVTLNGDAHAVSNAEFEIYNDEDGGPADWNLEVAMAGTYPRLLMSGLIDLPVRSGPNPLDVHHIDDPAEVLLSGRPGYLLNGLEPGDLTATPDGDGFLLAGRITRLWTAAGDTVGTGHPFEITVDLRASAEQ